MVILTLLGCGVIVWESQMVESDRSWIFFLKPAPSYEQEVLGQQQQTSKPNFVDEKETLADGPDGTVVMEKKGLTSTISITRDGQTFTMDSVSVEEEYGFWRYTYRDVRFSPNGRYAIFNRIGWEWLETMVYDTEKHAILKKLPSSQTTATTPDERALYSCGVDEMGGERHAKIFSLPEGNELASVFPAATTGSMLLMVECGMKGTNVEFTFKEWPSNDVVKTIIVDPIDGKIISR